MGWLWKWSINSRHVKRPVCTGDGARFGFFEAFEDDLNSAPIQNRRCGCFRDGGHSSFNQMTTTSIHTHKTERLWLTDLHLDMATDEARGHFLDKLAGIRYDAVLITGDISTSRHLTRHLAEISRACGPRPVYFILGNHDYPRWPVPSGTGHSRYEANRTLATDWRKCSPQRWPYVFNTNWP